jgi:hypothetical protein
MLRQKNTNMSARERQVAMYHSLCLHHRNHDHRHDRNIRQPQSYQPKSDNIGQPTCQNAPLLRHGVRKEVGQSAGNEQ